MNLKKNITQIIILIICLGIGSCIEEIPLISSQSEQNSFLVVQAELTDSLSTQKIFLSRSSLLNSEEILFEQNAQVSIEDSSGNIFSFQEISPGEYHSIAPFNATVDVSYQLNINTNDNLRYTSSAEMLSGTAKIDRLYVERIVSDKGIEGVGVFVDSENLNLNAQNYRFEYDETFKVIAPLWNAFDAIVVSTSPPEVDIELREKEERICFEDRFSRSIILGSTSDLSSNSLNRFLVTFLPRTDYAISHRYSILVKQKAISAENLSFYQTLKDLSNSESIFTDTQPGFLEGNIRSIDNEEEKVVGLFEVNSVQSQRLFFNYEDLFPGEELPPYAINCNLVSPPLVTPGGRSPLIEAILSGRLKYFALNEGQIPDGGPFLMTARACSDCTALGSNVIPEFWTE
ncbi:DUF4249 domain-containing protein [Spongiivirga sp. MCCC 1A20706]|uniref:DUF4249 domain-containing protein n=1 Tax=Spongiivirga sp. MCCC 1A20706 TaxID=3160963 RepID=UPI00397781AB